MPADGIKVFTFLSPRSLGHDTAFRNFVFVRAAFAAVTFFHTEVIVRTELATLSESCVRSARLIFAVKKEYYIFAITYLVVPG